jgi:hypothetical protein
MCVSHRMNIISKFILIQDMIFISIVVKTLASIIN